MTTWDVCGGRGELIQGDCLDVLRSMPRRSVDMIIGSPPYCDARTYEDGTVPSGFVMSRDPATWVEWMLKVSKAAVRVSRGPVLWVVGGVTRGRNYWPACEGLCWEWYKLGKSQYRPVYWHRSGVPGSGGDQWFRADVEYIFCLKHPGPLPFANPLAMARPPKYGMGGGMTARKRNGERDTRGRMGRGQPLPELANPGNMITTGAAGGGHLGNQIAHENEAPFPEALVEFFVRSFTERDNIVLDPFGGSGTTAAVCIKTGRRFKSIDVRASQIALMKKRIKQATRQKGFAL